MSREIFGESYNPFRSLEQNKSDAAHANFIAAKEVAQSKGGIWKDLINGMDINTVLRSKLLEAVIKFESKVSTVPSRYEMEKLIKSLNSELVMLNPDYLDDASEINNLIKQIIGDAGELEYKNYLKK